MKRERKMRLIYWKKNNKIKSMRKDQIARLVFSMGSIYGSLYLLSEAVKKSCKSASELNEHYKRILKFKLRLVKKFKL